ncbi:MAG: type IV pilus modification PilV family protein [Akkermansiaceae bacterium]
MNTIPSLNIGKSRLKSGFTLAESVIALGILVVLITGFLAVFGPAANAIRRTLSAQEASRLQATLERELGMLRPGDDADSYETRFEKVFDYIATSHDEGRTVLIYNYRGSLVQNRDDGTAEPEDEQVGVAGIDYLVQPMVRRLDDPLLEEDLDAVIGRVYFVKMTQLVYEGESLRVSDEVGKIFDPLDPSVDYSTNINEYPEAVLAFEAEFYLLPTRSIDYLRGPFDPTEFDRPVFRRNIGISR